jgi:predicted CoA-binding protein
LRETIGAPHHTVNHDNYSDVYILRILDSIRTFAMVGASDLWNRPSFFAMKYLKEKGYRVIPVNQRLAAAGGSILGEKAYGSIAEVPAPFDMVDFYLRSSAVGPVVDEAIAVAPEKGIRVIWMQLGVRDDAAAERAEKAGLQVVMNRCP